MKREMMPNRYPLWSTLSSLLLCSMLFAACSVDDTQTTPERAQTLVWSDEFDGPAGTLPADERWTYDIGTGDNGWGNGEFQYYTDRPENVAMDGEGNLRITARRENFGGQPFTSARIKTEGRFAQTYGRFEIRAKTPVGPGIWPALWLLGDDCDEIGWPQCGEIDIMELRGQRPNEIAGTLHGPGYSAGASIGTSYTLPEGRFDDQFRVFAIEWGTDYVEWYVDDFLFQRLTPDDVPGEWVYDDPFFLIMNIAVGGNYVGFPTSQTPFPQEMVVDYVRVYSLEGN